ncbi:hypothetical protein DICPUDRAFT_158383 [Dictyostelium purpureum]|uniref:UspA domain-containing protein n=1 Tax=Dictyostelium purpureum TaxID=5786 RepID=F1A1H4_DICPU|nr:uncharacterized protein DICPUDRAFT_158383 [Dictyostelium purpureum]EGC29959.1 hypothetical protein DICPUDRAFT_158383 [Dictyostelium purpureum]|eukprot:XP_003293519.1 hypothetical protein DICPUDRAFT_158383 [Dictyostelium purpureum]
MKFLLATDGSESSLKALGETFQMLNSIRDTLDLITVVDNPTLITEEVISSNIIEYSNIAEKILDHCERRCLEHNFILGKNLNRKILIGDVREEIIKYINQKGPFDMIVVGSRGLGLFKKLMLGSVSEYLVHHSPIPVYVVKLDGNCRITEPQL